MRTVEINDVTFEFEDAQGRYLDEMGVMSLSGENIDSTHPAANIVVAALGVRGDITAKPHYSCCFVEHENYVLLVQKTHPDWQKGRWNGVGGAAQDGESALDCANREFFEETGAAAPDLREFCVLEDASVVVHMFVGHWDSSEDTPAVAEQNDIGEELVWHSLDPTEYADWQDPSRSIDNLCWLIPMAMTDKFHLRGMVTASRRVLVDGEWIVE